MARHYTTKDFFRQMPNALLARYFQGRGVLGDLDFAALKDTQPDDLFAAWLTSPDEKRKAMDAEFLDIFEMSCEKGFHAILDEAAWHLTEDPQAYKEFVEKLGALANHHERAMVTFLEHFILEGGDPAFITLTRCLTGANGRTCRTSLRHWTRTADVSSQA